MPSYVISYDLKKEGQNYKGLTEELKKYNWNWHMQRSVWIIYTDETAIQITSRLEEYIDKNDKLFVAELTRNASWEGYNDKATKWLNDVL